MVKLFKDGDSMAIVTDAANEDMFIEQVSEVLDALVEKNAFASDWAFQFRYWLKQVADICCKYRGYKNDVLEKRMLCSSSHNIFPGDGMIKAFYEDGKVVFSE